MLQTVGYSTTTIKRSRLHNKCVFRVELDESQCKCVESLHSDRIYIHIFASYYVTHCRVNVFLFSFLFFRTSPCITVFLFLKSGDFASEDMTVSFRVWLSETISAGSGITVLIACGLKYFTCLSSAGVTLYWPCEQVVYMLL